MQNLLKTMRYVNARSITNFHPKSRFFNYILEITSQIYFGLLFVSLVFDKIVYFNDLGGGLWREIFQ
jgi:hypothetical protein